MLRYMTSKINRLYGGTNITVDFDNQMMLPIKIVTNADEDDDNIVKRKVIDEIFEKYNILINPEEINILEKRTDNEIYKTYKIGINNVYLNNKIKYSLSDDIISEIIKNVKTKDMPALIQSLWTNKSNRNTIIREMYRRNILEDPSLYGEEKYNYIFDNIELFNAIVYDKQNNPVIEIIKTLFIKAIEYKNEAIVKLILETHFEIVSDMMEEAIDECITSGTIQILELLKSYYSDDDINAIIYYPENLHGIIRSGNVDIIDYAMKRDGIFYNPQYYKDALISGNPEVLMLISDKFNNRNPFMNNEDLEKYRRSLSMYDNDDTTYFNPYSFLFSQISLPKLDIRYMEYEGVVAPFVFSQPTKNKNFIENLPLMFETIMKINPRVVITYEYLKFFWTCGNVDVIDKILKFFSPNIFFEREMMDIIIQSGDIDAVSHFINKHNQSLESIGITDLRRLMNIDRIDYNNLLFYACLRGNKKTVEFIIKNNKKIFDDEIVDLELIKCVIALGHRKVLDLLLKMSTIDVSIVLKKSLFIAGLNANNSMIRYLVYRHDQHEIIDAYYGAGYRAEKFNSYDTLYFLKKYFPIDIIPKKIYNFIKVNGQTDIWIKKYIAKIE